MKDFCQICKNKYDEEGNGVTLFSLRSTIYHQGKGDSIDISLALHESCLEKSDEHYFEYKKRKE